MSLYKNRFNSIKIPDLIFHPRIVRTTFHQYYITVILMHISCSDWFKRLLPICGGFSINYLFTKTKVTIFHLSKKNLLLYVTERE